jgi:hypothetical protein
VTDDRSDATLVTPTARIEVTGGGDPGPAVLAALTVALTPTGGSADGPGDRTPAWARAALLEGVGHRTPTRPSDLDLAIRLG